MCKILKRAVPEDREEGETSDGDSRHTKLRDALKKLNDRSRSKRRAGNLQQGYERGIEIGRTEGIETGKTEEIEIGKKEGIETGKKEGIEIRKTEGIEIGIEIGKKGSEEKIQKQASQIERLTKQLALEAEHLLLAN